MAYRRIGEKVLEYRLVVSDPKTGKAFQVVVKGDSARRLVGKKIGDVIKGSMFDPGDIGLSIKVKKGRRRRRKAQVELTEEQKKLLEELRNRLSKLTLKITGGSDNSGFPMRADLPGGAKRRLLLSGPPGFHPKERGMRKRVMVRGRMITEDIVQINTIVVHSEKSGE